MKFEHTQVFNFDGALRGMRNPLESWSKSDSNVDYVPYSKKWEMFEYDRENVEYVIGKNDLNLAQRLIRGGSEHRKWLRQVFVSVDITAPMYWWSEADTYSVGVTKNSTSKMHKLLSKSITTDCFEMDDATDFDKHLFERIIDTCESVRQMAVGYKDTRETDKYKECWKALIRILPESWLQTRTVTLNYEVVRNMVHQRKGHKLTEWNQFIDWAHTLPYAEELIFYDGIENS